MEFKDVNLLIIITLNLYPLSLGYVLEARKISMVSFKCYGKIIFRLYLFIYFHDAVDSSSPCPVYLTVSPTGHSVASSFLEINWGPRCQNPAEWLALYAQDPTVSFEAPLFSINTENQSTGHVKTDVKLGEIHFPYGWNKNEISDGHKPDHIKSACLPYFIASFNNKTLQTLDCLKIQPNWMKSIPQIQDIALKDLFIPGTHCSGCYGRAKGSRSILIKKFGIVQNFDIWMQLVFGIRYLDFSIGYVDTFCAPP